MMRLYICDECKINPKIAHECKGCNKLKRAAWYKKNRIKVLEKVANYRDTNIEKVRATKKEYRQTHIGRYNQRWYRKKFRSKKSYGNFWEAHRVFLEIKNYMMKEVKNEKS